MKVLYKKQFIILFKKIPVYIEVKTLLDTEKYNKFEKKFEKKLKKLMDPNHKWNKRPK